MCCNVLQRRVEDGGPEPIGQGGGDDLHITRSGRSLVAELAHCLVRSPHGCEGGIGRGSGFYFGVEKFPSVGGGNGRR